MIARLEGTGRRGNQTRPDSYRMQDLSRRWLGAPVSGENARAQIIFQKGTNRRETGARGGVRIYRTDRKEECKDYQKPVWRLMMINAICKNARPFEESDRGLARSAGEQRVLGGDRV